MTIETNGKRINIDIDPMLMFIFLGDKVDKRIINDIASPNFSIVVRPTGMSKFNSKEGDYSIIIRNDDGEEKSLKMPHRGAKMLYVLTLVCQVAVGGLTNRYFQNERAANVIKSLFDKLYRSGGMQWVKDCAADNHKISMSRTHAKGAVENDKRLDNLQRYWCGFEDEKREVGKNQVNLKRIRIPNDRIVFEDADGSSLSFDELIRQFPPLEDLFVFRNRNSERIRELHSLKTVDSFLHS